MDFSVYSMSEEFRPVTRKKWLAKNSLKKRPKEISDITYSECEVDVEKFQSRIEKAIEHMTHADYFIQAMITLDSSLQALAVPNRSKLMRIVCFGIGPFTRSFQALHQLAFILSAQRYCGIKSADFFDPIFQTSEKELLSRFNCSVMSSNCEAKYEANELILFYMPHCPNGLTNNLLWQNWRPRNLRNIVLINNSFGTLCSSKLERILKLDSGYLLKILEYVKEFPLEDDYKARNVFNDLSVHVFPISNLPKEDDVNEFWQQKPPPVYTDVEMISAEEFSKLNIS